jgi:threonine dehydratase
MGAHTNRFRAEGVRGPVSVEDVLRARQRLQPHLEATPLHPARETPGSVPVEVVLKLEHLQRTGSFKLRGALNRVAEVAASGARRVIAASAGNHALGVAAAASLHGIEATLVLPTTASPAKLQALEKTGAEIVLHGCDYDQAEAAMLRLAAERGLPVVGVYDAAVIAGHATLALEVLLEDPALDVLLVPAGAGGLLAGCVVVAQALRPSLRVIGLQPAVSPSMPAALAAGRVVPVTCGASLADGLTGNLTGGELPLSIIDGRVEAVTLVSEADIAAGMRWLLLCQRQVVEGSGAIGIGALLAGQVPDVAGRRVGVLLTGGNVAASTLAEVMRAEPGAAS